MIDSILSVGQKETSINLSGLTSQLEKSFQLLNHIIFNSKASQEVTDGLIQKTLQLNPYHPIIKELNFDKPLEIKAYQYDIVCNGIELSSGAIRNHIPELMYKLFSLAGYDKKQVDDKFRGMINALSYGAPPHGGIAPGIDRIVMLLADEKNIREVTMFPMNQNAQDLMMKAPSDVSEDQLKELGIAIKNKK